MRVRLLLLTFLVIGAISACAQDQANQGYVVHPNQEVQVTPLPSLVADSTSDADVIAASVAIVLRNSALCCGRKSALIDQLGSVTKFSLKDIGEQVCGKHYLESGQSVVISDQFWPAGTITPEDIVGSLQGQQSLLVLWNGRLYVLYGAVYNEYVYDSGTNVRAIQKLLLLDPRFDDDKRRYVTFNRQSDDWSKVAGLLSLSVTH